MATIVQDLARILTAYKVSCKMCQILAGLNYKFLARALCMGARCMHPCISSYCIA